MIKSLTVITILLLYSFSLNAQIPNGNFESWADDTSPESWTTNNFPNFWTTVTRTTAAQSGSYAAKMEIANYNGAPMFPVLTQIFPIDQAYGTLTGYYQFHPTLNEVVLTILTYYLKEGSYVGSGQIDIESASASYTAFSLETTLNNLTPDTVLIQFQIVSNSSSDPGIGSYALIDNLSFGPTTSVNSSDHYPGEFALNQNYPNPFNPATTIQFSLPEKSMVTLKVFNIAGEEVAILMNEEREKGIHSVNFDAGKLSSGIYFYKIQAGSYVSTRKMLLLK